MISIEGILVFIYERTLMCYDLFSLDI